MSLKKNISTSQMDFKEVPIYNSFDGKTCDIKTVVEGLQKAISMGANSVIIKPGVDNDVSLQPVVCISESDSDYKARLRGIKGKESEEAKEILEYFRLKEIHENRQ